MVCFTNSVFSVSLVASSGKGPVVHALRFDLVVNRCLFVEVKAVDEVHPINKAQLLSYRNC